MSALLALRDVSVDYGPVSAVRDVSLEVSEGEIFGLVGESGCGKTTLALAVMGLLPRLAQVQGRIDFQGEDVLALPEAALDPAFAVGEQVAETIRAHRPVSGREARRRATQLLTEVGIPAAERRYGDPPHRLSGGMQQRVVIATALANEPALLVADEPTTALDVTIQAQILALIRDLRDRHRTTVILIAHDLGVVAQLCDRAGVLYAGQLVEVAPVERIFDAPEHPYTKALLAALPTRTHGRGSLPVAGGRVPDLADPPPGCRFAPRCPVRMDACERVPALTSREAGHVTACWHVEAEAAA